MVITHKVTTATGVQFSENTKVKTALQMNFSVRQ